MKLTIQKWGNSAALRLPAGFLSQFDVKVGDAFDVEIDGRAAVLKVAKPSYTLDELLAQCNSEAEISEQEREWLDAPAMGGEAI